jgi:hypothetical protein
MNIRLQSRDGTLTFLSCRGIATMWRFDTRLRATLNKPLKRVRVIYPETFLVSGFFYLTCRVWVQATGVKQ